MIALQRCISFFCTAVWISCMYIRVPSLASLPPTPPHPLLPVTEQLPTSSLFDTWWCTRQCSSLNSSQLTLTLLCSYSVPSISSAPAFLLDEPPPYVYNLPETPTTTSSYTIPGFQGNHTLRGTTTKQHQMQEADTRVLETVMGVFQRCLRAGANFTLSVTGGGRCAQSPRGLLRRASGICLCRWWGCSRNPGPGIQSCCPMIK